jgi:hypothetical protein
MDQGGNCVTEKEIGITNYTYFAMWVAFILSRSPFPDCFLTSNSLLRQPNVRPSHHTTRHGLHPSLFFLVLPLPTRSIPLPDR